MEGPEKMEEGGGGGALCVALIIPALLSQDLIPNSKGMHYRSSIAHFIGSTLISFKYCSSFYLRMVCTYSHSSIAHLEWFVDSEFS